MIWKKPTELKYTNLCQFVDENIEKIKEHGKEPYLEDKIYNYLWLIIKALAIKQKYFKNFEDYDAFAFHGASRIYKALLKNMENQGKIIKGKEIKPIKSCLNYIKALMYPMKVEYQNEAFTSHTGADYLVEKMGWNNVRNLVVDQLNSNAGSYELFRNAFVNEFLQDGGLESTLDEILAKLPFKPGTVEYKRIRMSILMYSIQILRNKKHLEVSRTSIIPLWKLPKSISEYIKLLIQEFYTAINEKMLQYKDMYYTKDEVADQLLNKIDGLNN